MTADADFDTGQPHPAPTDARRQATALERIATALEAIAAGLLTPTITAVKSYQQPIVPTEEPDADGWIEWHGGRPPIATGAVVDVRDNDGTVWEKQEYRVNSTIVGEPFWTWRECTRDNRIVAYRVTK